MWSQENEVLILFSCIIIFGKNRKCFEAAVGSMKELWGSFWNYRFIGDLFWQEIELVFFQFTLPENWGFLNTDTIQTRLSLKEMKLGRESKCNFRLSNSFDSLPNWSFVSASPNFRNCVWEPIHTKMSQSYGHILYPPCHYLHCI